MAPISMMALMTTLVLIFAFQADNITGKFLHVLLIAIPILIQVYFNSALARIAATFDRVARLRARRKRIPTKGLSVWKVLPGLGLGRFEHGKLALVYRKVNPLKHDPAGLAKGRRVSLADAIEAFGEMLDLLEIP